MRFPLATLFFAVALASGAAGAAMAQSTPPAEDPGLLKSFFKLMGQAVDDPGGKDFVLKTRPESRDADYVPLYARPVDRPVKVLSPSEVQAKKAELDNLRAQHDRISGRKPAPAATEASKPPTKKPGRKPNAG